MAKLAVAVTLSLTLAITASADATERDQKLDMLFTQLLAAEDAEAAKGIQTQIEAIWYDSESDSSNLLFLRATSAMEQGVLETALVHLDDLVRLYPDFAEGWNVRATVHFNLGNLRMSRQDIAETLRREPRHYGALSGLGLVNLKRGEPSSALYAYRQALDVNPWLEVPRAMVEILSKTVQRDL